MSYKDKTVLIYDTGGYSEVAKKLSKDFGKVYYFINWQKGFPKSGDTLVGTGFNEFERTLTFWDKINEIDLFVFTDIGSSDIQNYLVSINKRVWGARNGDCLELDRVLFFDTLKEVGLPVANYEVIKGLDALDKHLQTNEDKIIKINSIYRGDAETFNHIDYDISKPILDKLRHAWGMRSNYIEFIVQDKIEKVAEIGYDGFCIDGEYPKNCLSGVEKKDLGYFGKSMKYDDLPKEVILINEKIAPVLKEYGYRGMISTEIIIDPKGTPYFIDITCRFPSPPTCCLLQNTSNLANILWNGADGKIIDFEFDKEFVGEIICTSPFAKEGNFYQLFSDKEIKDNVYQQYGCVIDGITYITPQDWENERVCELVCNGDTPEQVIKGCQELSDKVKGFQLTCNASAVNDAFEDFKKVY